MSNNPEDILKNPEQIKQLIGILSSLLPTDDLDKETEAEPKKPKTRRKPAQTKKTTTNKSTRFKKDTTQHTNKFVDMPESQMFRENPDVSQKLYQQPPMKRRPRKNKINVTCRICGKREEISSGLLYGDVDRYKCNKCCSNAG